MEIPSRMVHVESGAGWHEATCHPRPGGACEARALCREGRRGSPVAPCSATRRKGHPGLEGGAGWHEATCHPRLGGACEARALYREGRRGAPVAPCPATRRKGCDRTGPHGTGTHGTGWDKKKRVARMSHPLEKRQLPTLPTGVSVPSAWTGLTSLFGMGRGGSPAL